MSKYLLVERDMDIHMEIEMEMGMLPRWCCVTLGTCMAFLTALWMLSTAATMRCST